MSIIRHSLNFLPIMLSTVENRSIVMKKTNNWFEGAGCQEINEEKTKRINQQQFRRLRKKLNTYKIKRCKPDYFSELLGLGDVDSVGGSYLGLVLLSENGREMLDENGSRLCGDIASLSSSIGDFF